LSGVIGAVGFALASIGWACFVLGYVRGDIEDVVLRAFPGVMRYAPDFAFTTIGGTFSGAVAVTELVAFLPLALAWMAAIAVVPPRYTRHWEWAPATGFVVAYGFAAVARSTSSLAPRTYIGFMLDQWGYLGCLLVGVAAATALAFAGRWLARQSGQGRPTDAN
jgi:hypothetical protein